MRSSVMRPAWSLHMSRIVVMVMLASLVSGCAWMQRLNPFSSDDDELRPAPLMEFTREARVRTEWSGSVGAGLGRRYNRLQPAIRGDRVYTADAYGMVEARNRETGERIWQTRIGVPEGALLGAIAVWERDNDRGSFVTGGVYADDFAVFVGTTRGDFVALRADDGGELWRVTLSSEVLAPAASSRDHIFAVTGDGRLRALSRSDGRQIWSYDTQVPVLSLRGSSAPVFSDPLVFQGFSNGRLTALRADSGQVVWEVPVGVPTGRSELERMADVDGSPLITPAGAFAVSYQGAVKSVRLQDGFTQWERPMSSFVPLAEGYGQLYVVDEQGVLHALDQGSGSVVWQQDGLLRRGVTGAASVGAHVVVGDSEGYLHVFAQTDGRPVARTRIDRRGIRVAPVSDGSRLYVLGNSGRLEVVRIESD